MTAGASMLTRLAHGLWGGAVIAVPGGRERGRLTVPTTFQRLNSDELDRLDGDAQLDYLKRYVDHLRTTSREIATTASELQGDRGRPHLALVDAPKAEDPSAGTPRLTAADVRRGWEELLAQQEADEAAVTTGDLIAAWEAPGPLTDQPAVVRLLDRRNRSGFRVIEGGAA